jgi:hypothetical protein
MTSFRIRKGAFEIKVRLAILDTWYEVKGSPTETRFMHYLIKRLSQERKGILPNSNRNYQASIWNTSNPSFICCSKDKRQEGGNK